jgi:hypothetical protein
MLLIATIAVLSAAVFIAAKVSVWATGKPIDMSFLGALIGAAGTIFAATVAYVAVQLQIDAAREQTIESQKLTQKFERQQAEAFLTGLKAARDELTRVVVEFSDLGNTPGAHRDRLLRVYTSGRLPLNMSAGMLPGTFQGRSQAYLQRLNNLANQIRSLSDRMAVPTFSPFTGEWNAMDQHVVDAVADGNKFIAEIESEIAARQRAP